MISKGTGVWWRRVLGRLAALIRPRSRRAGSAAIYDELFAELQRETGAILNRALRRHAEE